MQSSGKKLPELRRLLNPRAMLRELKERGVMVSRNLSFMGYQTEALLLAASGEEDGLKRALTLLKEKTVPKGQEVDEEMRRWLPEHFG